MISFARMENAKGFINRFQMTGKFQINSLPNGEVFLFCGMNEKDLLEQTMSFVKKTLESAEAGHDWFHIERVYRNARLINAEEGADELVVALGALLHDIADSKFHDGDEQVGPKRARDFLIQASVPGSVIDHVVEIIKNVSFKNTLDRGEHEKFNSPELAVVQDADRLDAIGAIGIARTFHYGGFKNRQIYNPDIAPDPDLDKEAYKKSTAPTINHFYEKLLRIRSMMNTKAGKALAQQRHAFMEGFLEEFYAEWEGRA